MTEWNGEEPLLAQDDSEEIDFQAASEFSSKLLRTLTTPTLTALELMFQHGGRLPRKSLNVFNHFDIR